MTTWTNRRYDRDFRLSAVARMEAGENVAAMSRELGVRRKLLYDWRRAFRLGGAEALRAQGRPGKDERAMAARDREPSALVTPPSGYRLKGTHPFLTSGGSAGRAHLTNEPAGPTNERAPRPSPISR